MRTDNIRALVRQLHADALMIANEVEQQARAARVFGKTAVALEPADCTAIGDALMALMNVNKCAIDLTDKESARADAAREQMDLALKAATDGMALVGYIRRMTFRQLLVWWLRYHNAQPKKVIS